MKKKLFGLALMFIGALTFGWVAVIVLIAKGIPILLYGLIPLVAGWLIFNSACKEESPAAPNRTVEETDPSKEIKEGFGRVRSFFKGLWQTKNN